MPEIATDVYDLGIRWVPWVRPGIIDPVLLEIMTRLYRRQITPAEADDQLEALRSEALRYGTSIRLFHERIEKEASQPFWSFSLAMAWVGEGALPAAIVSCCRLKHWGRHELGGRTDLANARGSLLAALREGRVFAFGRPRPADPHSKIGPLEFRTLELDPHSDRDWLQRDGTVAYYDVVVDAGELKKAWPEVSRAEQRKRQTAGAEGRALKQLVKLIKGHPGEPVPKDELKKHLQISGRALERIFPRAVLEANAPAWSKPGRRRKAHLRVLSESLRQ